MRSYTDNDINHEIHSLVISMMWIAISYIVNRSPSFNSNDLRNNHVYFSALCALSTEAMTQLYFSEPTLYISVTWMSVCFSDLNVCMFQWRECLYISVMWMFRSRAGTRTVLWAGLTRWASTCIWPRCDDGSAMATSCSRPHNTTSKRCKNCCRILLPHAFSLRFAHTYIHMILVVVFN